MRLPKHLHRFLIAAIVAWCLVFVASCAIWRATRDNAMKAGPPTAVAVLATPLGPLVHGLMVFLTAVASNSLIESAALASGELQGEGAALKEAERLRATLRSLGAKMEGLEGALTAARKAEGLYRWRWVIAAVALAVLGLWIAIKYLWPWSRAARNFWSGLLDLVRGTPGATRKIVAATGIAHTSKDTAAVALGSKVAVPKQRAN